MMLKPKVKKIISFIFISIVGIFIGVAVSFYILLKLSVPITDGKLELSGLSHPVEITYDKMGIPQIWAETSADAYFALGYQHAADRMFQMDLSRRLAQGKLSEMLGSITVEIDIEQRQIGHYRLAAKALETLSEKNKQRLLAYANGVNAYKKSCRALPFEYRFLPIDFEDWTIVDCLAFLSFQTWFSNSLMSRDEFYFSLYKKVGREKAKSLFFEYPDWAPATIPSQRQQLNFFDSLFLNEYKNYTSNITPKDDKIKLYKDSTVSLYQPFQRAIAQKLFENNKLPFQLTHSSNAWVVAPEKSISGKAMLASDPHLELTRLPQFWYAVGLHIKNDSVNVLGITTPGLPFVIMGHNGQCAWAFTAGGIDITEYCVEKINPEDSSQYLTQDGWREFELIKDSILIAGIDSFKTVTHKFSCNGMIVSEDKNLKAAYALHWAGFDMDLNTAVTNAFQLHRIKNFEQFQKAVTNFGALDANMMYADADGNIGYQLTTPMPIHSDEKSYLPVNESNKSNKWSGYYPLEKTAFIKNPQCGWLANCNNLPMEAGHIEGYFFADRILSINELLQSKDKYSIEDMYRFQTESKDRYLKRLKNMFAQTLENIGQSEKAQMIRQWDGSTESNSKETALINIFLSQLKKFTFKDELGSLSNQVPSKWIEQIEKVGDAFWFDDVTTSDQMETMEDISMRAMKKAVEIVDDKNWGGIHSLTMQHPMAMIPIVGTLLGLSSEREPWGGTPGSLNSSFFREIQENKFTSAAGPSWRFVIDFADIDKVSMVLPAGSSGNPMSEHFFDFYDMWKKGKYWNVPFHYEKVKEKAASSLILEPSKKL